MTLVSDTENAKSSDDARNNGSETTLNRLLVVDDDDVVCQIVQAFLSLEGWQIDTATGIADADVLVKSCEYPVIICDVHLPGDSLEWLNRVRSTNKHCQVIMFTGDPSVSSAREAMQVGAYDYVTKPARREELVRSVQRALERHDLLRRQDLLIEENIRYRKQLEEMVLKRTEQLRASELMYRAVFDRSVDAIFLVSIPTGSIDESNIAACRLLGYRAADLVGRHVSEFVGSQFDSLLHDAQNPGLKEWRLERVAFLGAEQRSRIAQVSAGLIEFDGVRRLQIVARDITDHLELMERNELMELELLSEQRLANIGLLASGVAHNINTPLMGIYGVAQLIKMKYPDIQDIDGVITQVDRITAIIRNLMWKSRQEQETSFQEIDLNQLLREELNFMQADLDFKHNVDKVYEFADNVPTIMGRYSDFSQSLTNVVRNALDAMYGRENRCITVISRVHDGDICVTIEDNGCGMEQTQVGKIFMPFFTTKPLVGQDREGEPTGTGLGLSTVQKLLAPYAVRYSVESEPNHGTRFTICIPIELNSPSARSQEQAATR